MVGERLVVVARPGGVYNMHLHLLYYYSTRRLERRCFSSARGLRALDASSNEKKREQKRGKK